MLPAGGKKNQQQSRTPNRSHTASPSQPNTLQPPKQDSKPPVSNPWTSGKKASVDASFGSKKATADARHTPLNGFDVKDAKAFLDRETAGTTYKAPDLKGKGGAPGKLADGTSFLEHLAKEVARAENGG